MKKTENLIIFHDPGISSYNIGDEIISDSIKYEMSDVLKDEMLLSLSTHLPLSYRYLRTVKNPKYQFVCGSNLLKSTVFGLKRQWDIKLRNQFYVHDCILIGVGMWQYSNKIHLYTRLLYRCVLSQKFIHSVRDKYTKEKLNSIGINNVVNTGCPSLWRFTPEFCKKINQKKSRSVVFTITDYSPDLENDKLMIEEILNSYETIYFFPQGSGDIEYLKQLIDINLVEFISPTLKAYDEFLKKHSEVDYVGTRLHGGIRAMQYFHRSIIISIDNRAKEMSDNFNFPIIERKNISTIKQILFNDIIYDLKLPLDDIRIWKDQFYEKK